MSRQFLYMVAMKSKERYTLHRFNPSRLFYPKARGGGGPGRASETAAVERCSLPPPTMSFHPIQFENKHGRMEFMLYGRDRNKIVCTDQTGRAVLYDDGSHAVRMLPNLRVPKWWSMALPFEDSLLVMETVPKNDQEVDHQSFEALMYGESKAPGMFDAEDFFWHPIPPPPYVHTPGYGRDNSGMITAQAAGGGSGVWISAGSFGTYCLDTASGNWSKAGEWPLPFRGPAEYVPEYDLWFGVSAREEDGVLCASDLGAASATRPPAVQEWEGFGAPEGRELVSYLLHLGAGRFCVAKLYKTIRQWADGDETTVEFFLMFTGVEIQRGCGGELQVVRHKSFSYGMGGACFMPKILY